MDFCVSIFEYALRWVALVPFVAVMLCAIAGAAVEVARAYGPGYTGARSIKKDLEYAEKFFTGRL